jgi:hypothetical protein
LFFSFGFSYSSGGCRAAYAAKCFIQLLDDSQDPEDEERTLLDRISHVSSTSGSTWFLAEWLLNEDYNADPTGYDEYADESRSLWKTLAASFMSQGSANVCFLEFVVYGNINRLGVAKFYFLWISRFTWKNILW